MSQVQITRDNYEAFLLDYCEGQLDAASEKALWDFFAQHPELQPALDELPDEESRLKPLPSTPYDESFLLYEGALPPLSVHHFENYCIAETEGLLNEDESSQLQQFIAQHPQYKKVYNTYKACKLSGENHQVLFPQKESLKKRAAIISPIWLRSAAAALLLAILGWWLWPQNETITKQPTTASTTMPDVVNKGETPLTDTNQHHLAKSAESTGQKSDAFIDAQLAEEPKAQPAQTQPGNQKKRKQDRLEHRKASATKENAFAQTDPQQDALPIDTTQEDIALSFPEQPISDSSAMASAQVQKKGSAKTKTPKAVYTLAEYAQLQVKRKVLNDENTSDPEIEEQDVAQVVAKGLNALGSERTQYHEEEAEESNTVTYGLRIGQLGFSRTIQQKN